MEKAEEIIQLFKQVRTLPHIISRLTRLINDENSTLQDFEEVIRSDPALVARLLTLVNSSYYGVVRKVDSISRAVALLGMKNLHNIAMTDALQAMAGRDNIHGTFSFNRLWLHCTACGICCKMIAERIFSINGDDAYLTGILHDIGLIVEVQVDERNFIRAFDALTADPPSIVELENRYLGTDHCRIGYLLAREWLLADPIAEAIRDHHAVTDDLTPASARGILQLSEYIVSQLGYPMKSGVSLPLAPVLANHLQDNMAEYKVLAEDLPDEISRIRDMYEN
ncbi:MAG TPA: HDOD domain-containing protein [Desulfobulbus sp.]|nr:HDOD domain-containing protein [Desulfobulbus sp.]